MRRVAVVAVLALALLAVAASAANASTVLLRPNVDYTNTMTVVGATTAFDALNDVVTQPTAVGVTDYIHASGFPNRVSEVGLGSTPIGTQTVTAAKLWFYTGLGNATSQEQ